MEQIICYPFPENGIFKLEARLSPRACLYNQAGGKMPICLQCKTGEQIKKAHPEIQVILARRNDWGFKKEVL